MNEFSSPSDSGLLKVNYEDDQSPLSKALKKKRERLAETRLGLENEDERREG